MSTTCIIILISIIIVIVLGALLKINFGLLGIAAAFLCGCLIADMKPGDVLSMWNTKLFFQMFSITFFYAFAINNGTLELLSKKLVYATRKASFLIPIILFVVAAILAGIGPGTISMFLIITPIIMQVAKETGMKLSLAAIVTGFGVNAGGWSPLTVNGIALRGIMESSGYDTAMASHFGMMLFRNMLLSSVIFFAIAYIVCKGWKCKAINYEKVDAFNPKQKISLALIIIFTILIVLPPALENIAGGSFFSTMTNKLDATFLAVIFGVISIICKVEDEKKAISSVPWKTIIMVCGMGMIISVASEAGAMTYISEFIGQNFAVQVLPYVMCLVAAVMSLFSSTMGVVVPTLYPIIGAVCAASGANPALLFSVVPIGATSAGNSPFSLFGGLVQAPLDDKDKNKMFFELIIIAIVSTLFTLALIGIGIIRG